MFHATNMKSYQGKKDALTPFVEPGYERMEAGRMRTPETPLLLSPDEDLNQKATDQYKRRKLSAKQQVTKQVNAARDRSERLEQAKRRLSNSQNEDVWLLVDADDHESVEEDSVDDQSEEAANRNDDEETENRDSRGEAYAVIGKTTNNNGVFKNNLCTPSADERRQILEAAHIQNYQFDDEGEDRITAWITEIITQENTRRNCLTERERILESEIATDCEYIGWILGRYHEQWVRNRFRSPQRSQC